MTKRSCLLDHIDFKCRMTNIHRLYLRKQFWDHAFSYIIADLKKYLQNTSQCFLYLMYSHCLHLNLSCPGDKPDWSTWLICPWLEFTTSSDADWNVRNVLGRAFSMLSVPIVVNLQLSSLPDITKHKLPVMSSLRFHSVHYLLLCPQPVLIWWGETQCQFLSD